MDRCKEKGRQLTHLSRSPELHSNAFKTAGLHLLLAHFISCKREHKSPQEIVEYSTRFSHGGYSNKALAVPSLFRPQGSITRIRDSHTAFEHFLYYSFLICRTVRMDKSVILLFRILEVAIGGFSPLPDDFF